MKTSFAFRFWAPAVLAGAAVCTPSVLSAQAVQAAPTQALLESAHALEVRGRVDLAAQRWQQVLLADPNNTEALGGLARAAKLNNNQKDLNKYLDALRRINPNDPGISRVEQMGTRSDTNVQLRDAGKLAQQGQYAQSMQMYRKVYGDQPPAGDAALSYYETEAATEDGRPHAVAGLRSLVQKFPSDPRYQVALGRILTYNPKTRQEGRRLLAAQPADPAAVEALRQSLVWDQQNTATAGDIRSYLAKHQDAQLAEALRNQPRSVSGRRGSAPQTAEQRAQNAALASRNAEDNAAYRALNGNHIAEAEQRFKAILARNPEEANALAGMGYIRMQQQNFAGAISFLSQAKQDGSRDAGVDTALATSRFFYTLGEGSNALNQNDLLLAEKQYRAALLLRPNSPEALEGLGGTLLKAQQPETAVPYFAEFVKVRPSAAHAWRGLFIAEFGSGNGARALETERHFPPAVRAELMRDPLFLSSLSSAYLSVGRDADAQRVLKSSLDLPFPADSSKVELDTQLQYAGLLQQGNHLDQASGLYRQVLAKDQNNTAAWQGLISVEHLQGQDAQALATLESMPPASYARAMRESGFESTVAAVYQAQQRFDVAQEILEKSLAQQGTSGQKASVANEIQLAGIYLQRNDPQQAYPLYRQVLTQYPDRVDAWKGLLSALHSTGHDAEALAEVQQIPAKVRPQLENDPEYLQTVGAVYASLGQPQEAQIFLRRVQQHYAQTGTQAPGSVDIQNAWLLYNGQNDQGLYRQLLGLGNRTDLTDPQRRTVQTIWANWAVRRANQAAARGDEHRSVSILNATAQAFSDNPEVIKILAGGYASDGRARQAVAIWKAQDLKTGSVTDYRAAVGAALSADDQKDAETWLRFGLDQYPHDADLLNLAAKFEQARGDNNRAAEYYRASLKAMPKPDPGAELAAELSRPGPSSTPARRPGQDLATLMAPGKDDTVQAAGDSMYGQTALDSLPGQPYLPGSAAGSALAPVPMYGGRQSTGQTGLDVPTSSYPQPMTAPQARPMTTAPSRPGDYLAPQSSLRQPLPPHSTEHSSSMLSDYQPAMYRSAEAGTSATFATAVYRPGSAGLLHSISFADYDVAAAQPAQQQTGTPVDSAASGQTAPPQTATPQAATPQKPGPLTQQPASDGEVYGPYVPYVPPVAAPSAVQLGSTPPVRTIPQPQVTDVLPTARYVPNARDANSKTRGRNAANPDVAAAAAAAARQRAASSAAARSGESRPPDETYSTAPVEGVQYNPSQAATQVAQPGTQQGGSNQTLQGQGQGTSSSNQIPQQTGDSNGQQYPQPYTQSRPVTHNRAPIRRRRQTAPATAEQPGVPTPQPVYQGLSYPGVGQPLTFQPYPVIGPAYPLGVPPTDADLINKRVPPLRGGYGLDTLAPQLALTPRQQTERDLQALESSYSGWLGGTVNARYRSGTVGLDRLTDLETTFEASATLANSIRFTIVPRAVFLNSGTIDSTQYAGLPNSSVPVLGSLALNAVNAPAQQNANGIGGELQVAGTRFAAAVGYTPYEFLVRNVTGRALFLPTRHVTLFFNRDAVTETQLSYAGLRDPGQANAVFGGPIWGGVVQTGGGVRFAFGDEKTGFYISADGADLTGYHVLENNKFEGSAGAYFLAHTFPGYGRLNVGASAFGMHYAHNERGLTYGLGGYFSPEAYFLASVPVTFVGRYGSNLHYTVAGSVGVQTFQEDSQIYFPLDRGLQNSFQSNFNSQNATNPACTTAQLAARTCASSPNNSNTGGNYSVNTEGAYRIADHWFAGGFLSANNTNNYNTVTGGFFVRYLFRPQYGTDDLPTGLFPVEGFRPLQVP